MARKPRFHVAGAFYHVMLRGNDGQTIFFSDKERCRMCLLIQEGVEKYGHRIHAFCFMKNHIHLLVQVGNASLSKIIHNLSFRYSQFINRVHQKKGHLFQGRFKAILIEEKNYLLRLLRYIHMNPVRAFLVEDPKDYRWSSHGTYLGQTEFVWITTDHSLGKFADGLGEARLKYRDFVLQQESEDELQELRQGFSDGQILGDDKFIENIRNSRVEKAPFAITIQMILKAISQVYNVDEASLASPLRSYHLSLIRGVAASFARKNGYSLEELAKIFKRDGSSLSRLIQRFLQIQAINLDVQNQYQQFEYVVSQSRFDL